MMSTAMPNLRSVSKMLMMLFVIMLLSYCAAGQHVPGYNYNEPKPGTYTLLDPLLLSNSQHVTTASQWKTQRRPEILRLFEENIFGHMPEAAQHLPVNARVLERDDHALGGLAVREQVELSFNPSPGISPGPHVLHTLRLLIYIPAAAAEAHRPSPMVLGLNFGGNQSVLDDPAIQPTPIWTKPKGATELVHVSASDETRGSATKQWQVKLLLERRYGLATVYYGDLEPDFKDASQYSVRQLFQRADQKTSPDA